MTERQMCSATCKNGTACPYRAKLGNDRCGHHPWPDGTLVRAAAPAPVPVAPARVRTVPAPVPVPAPVRATAPAPAAPTPRNLENRRVVAAVAKGASRHRFIERKVLVGPTWVANVTGSSKDKAAWKTFYEKYAELPTPATCRIKDCEKKVGATGHMYIRDDADGTVYNYLIPICSHHNSSKELDYDRAHPERTHWLQVKTQRGATVAVKIRENPVVVAAGVPLAAVGRP